MADPLPSQHFEVFLSGCIPLLQVAAALTLNPSPEGRGTSDLAPFSPGRRAGDEGVDEAAKVGCTLILSILLGLATLQVMTFELFTRVALRENFPQHQLHRNDVATIVDHHPIAEGEDGYSLEVFNAVGETIAVLVVAESQIEPLKSNEVLHIRMLEEVV